MAHRKSRANRRIGVSAPASESAAEARFRIRAARGTGKALRALTLLEKARGKRR
jgi:hypothetical protein